MTVLIGHDAVERALDWPALIAQLRDWYRADAVEAPARQVLTITQPDGRDVSLLIMPAWVPGGAIGVKAVTFFPDNAEHGLATINAGYLLFDGKTGRMQAALDGDALTARRTAAASALAACRSADVISTITAATSPIIHGAWLRPGTHLDLIGAFKGDMRESDDQAIAQAQVFVDRRDGASLAGDLAQPLADGVITPDHLLADLAELCRGDHPGRQSGGAFTVFKSAGMALQDLAAATLARDQLMSG